MSYDLMVFDPAAAPAKKRAPFLDWYDQHTEWKDDKPYDDPTVAAPALRAFYHAIAQRFPALQDDGDSGTDYTIGAALIYMSFGWESIDTAYDTVFALASEHAVGFFDLSSDLAETWLPDGKGGLYLAHAD